MNTIELNFYQEQNKWKHNLIPIESSKNQSDGVVDLFIYKNHYVLLKKFNVFLGKQDCRHICKRCRNSHTSENVVNKHKQQCDQKETTSIRTTNESHLLWKKHVRKNPKYFRIYADFEADNEIDSSSKGK